MAHHFLLDGHDIQAIVRKLVRFKNVHRRLVNMKSACGRHAAVCICKPPSDGALDAIDFVLNDEAQLRWD